MPGKFHGEEPGRLQSTRSQKVGHNLATENAYTRKDEGRQGRLEDPEGKQERYAERILGFIPRALKTRGEKKYHNH